MEMEYAAHRYIAGGRSARGRGEGGGIAQLLSAVKHHPGRDLRRPPPDSQHLQIQRLQALGLKSIIYTGQAGAGGTRCDVGAEDIPYRQPGCGM